MGGGLFAQAIGYRMLDASSRMLEPTWPPPRLFQGSLQQDKSVPGLSGAFWRGAQGHVDTGPREGSGARELAWTLQARPRIT